MSLKAVATGARDDIEETPCDFWNGDKRVACSWVEQDLCSNPECKKYAPPAKVQASAKSAGIK
jgi:hypothetical protein